jgi:hypothetical protein
MARYVSAMGQTRKAYRIYVRKPFGKCAVKRLKNEMGALAHQRGPRQLQIPLVRAPLATTYLRLASRQSQFRNHPLLRNGSVIKFPWKRIGTKI